MPPAGRRLMATPPPAAEQSPGARLPSPVEWTSNRSATRPDPLHPMHRHDVGRARAPDRTELEHVAIAMRQGQHGCRSALPLSQRTTSGTHARFPARLLLARSDTRLSPPAVLASGISDPKRGAGVVPVRQRRPTRARACSDYSGRAQRPDRSRPVLLEAGCPSSASWACARPSRDAGDSAQSVLDRLGGIRHVWPRQRHRPR